MGGPPTQVVIQVLSIFVIPADNFIMGGGIILALAGSVMTIVRFTKSNR
jgi:small neutral amino acid transporter SnatA (MarC family)